VPKDPYNGDFHGTDSELALLIAEGVKISELARRSGIRAHALRSYESARVLPGAARDPNGCRQHTETDLGRGRMVVIVRRRVAGGRSHGRSMIGS